MDLAAATSERAAAAAGSVGGGEPDRLSALPDCLLHVIMSSLKARQAVQTCVLSRRWRHLWPSVPCLDVDINEFMTKTAASAFENGAGSGGGGGGDQTASSAGEEEEEDTVDIKEWEDFEDFTVNLMRRCDIGQLDSFRLHADSNRAPWFGDRHAAGWLRRAIKHCTPRDVSGSWRLKRLHLSFVRVDGRFAKHVSSACPSLEDLELHDCRCRIQSVTSNSLKNLVLKDCTCRGLSEIRSPTLKTLVVDRCSNTKGCTLVILAPAVTSLHLAVMAYLFRGGFSTGEMPSLVKASIHLRGHSSILFFSGLENDPFLSSVSNVTCLELLGVGTTVLGNGPRFQEFMNLRSLALMDYCDLSDDFSLLGFFLQSSPNLEKLTLQHCKFPKYSKSNKGTHKLNKASSSEFRGLDFMCKNLKVEIIYKDGDSLRQLVKLLLRVNVAKSHIKLTKV